MATSLLILTFITLSATTVLGQSSSSIVLRPADTSVAATNTLPLSCVATSNTQAPRFTWKKINQTNGQISDVAKPSVNQEYRSEDGVDFYISTLILCNMGFGDAGTYICNVTGSTTEENIRVSVHVPSSANFQLRFSGVGNCGGWITTRDLTATANTIIQHLRNNVLNNVCTQQCSYTITNERFDCVGNSNSDSITFLATIEHQRQSDTLSESADDLVNNIGVWKETGATITVSSQSLSVEASCDVTASTPCGEEESSIVPIVGGAVGGGVLALIVIVVLIVVVVVCVTRGRGKHNRKGENLGNTNEAHELQQNTTYADVTQSNPAYMSSKRFDYTGTPNNDHHLTKNAAYERSESVHYYTAADSHYDYIN